MPEEFIIRHCAPTLAGLKAGNLLSCPDTGLDETRCAIAHWNHKLGQKGVRFALLGRRNGRVLILAYRLSRLERALREPGVRSFLSGLGYPYEHIPDMIAHLGARVSAGGSFPHEIGVFLGYPLADVKAFIEQKGENCACCGCWKAYADQNTAKEAFEKYKKCAEVYRRCHARGADICRLTITA